MKMKFIADLHIHSMYSRATAKDLDFEHLYRAAQIKGITVVGTGDFTYPAWIEEIETKLEETEPGLFSLKKEIAERIDKTIPVNLRGPVRFILQTEISNIYKREGRVRKNHNLVYFPDINSVKKFNAKLDTIGNIKSDGRPILGLDARDLLSIMLDISDKGFFVPAHIWTPWFSLFGSKSGFDSIEECFSDLKSHIFAVETGLSSDPPMNWRVQDLDHVRLISNSDAHSPGYLGRNANVFNTELNYFHIRQALEENDLNAFWGTLDMYPHQGKYHYDGHRKCNVSLNPAETADVEGICPGCGRMMTLRVLNRAQELATRPEGYRPENRQGFMSIIPLSDILSEIFDVGPKTKKVVNAYKKATESLGPELQILTDLSIEDIEGAKIPLLAEAVKRMREGKIQIEPGYDGEFGKVGIFSREEKQSLKGEKTFSFALSENEPEKKKRTVSKRTPDAERKIKKSMVPSLLTDRNMGVLEGLNPDQQKAVESTSRAIIIQAGPGTGKTRTLTAKIAYLVSEKGIDPGSILALTFTNKAAKELEKRIQKYLPGPERQANTVTAATFHAFCLALLKEHKGFDATIMDDAMRISLIKESMGGKAKKGEVNAADHLIGLCKQNLLGPEDELEKIMGQDESGGFRQVYNNYGSLCKERNVADFEDLIFLTVGMLTKNEHILSAVLSRYRYIFIDEYQDLNYGQYELVRLISKENHIVVIGDPDQSIYGFRGSDNIYFKRFGIDFPGHEKIILTQNYRSAQTILDASFQVICKSSENDEKIRIFSDIGTAKRVIIKETASDQAEAVAVGKMIETLVGGTSFFSMDARKTEFDNSKEYSFSDFAVLFRTRKQCEVFSSVFEKAGIPFQSADKTGMLKMEGISQLISLCRIMVRKGDFIGEEPLQDGFSPETIQSLRQEIQSLDNEAGLRLLSERSGLHAIIKKKEEVRQAFEKLIALAKLHHDLKGFLDAFALDQDADTLEYDVEKVSLLTLHAAKGLEFPVVFVTGCEQGLVPFARDGEHIDNLEEERRLFYVAMTRAMDILCLTYAKKRSIYGNSLKRQRSLFIEDIEKKLTRLEKSADRMPEAKKPEQMELF
ncbi:MAG: UvrD-helicase domain-containing protein [Desulfobacula sp.]|jgi:DNA helicase-2/ATP-dependent DNA helicase PcrA